MEDLRRYVDVLNGDIQQLRRAAAGAAPRAASRFLLRASVIADAIDRLVLGAALQAASMRSRNFRRRWDL